MINEVKQALDNIYECPEEDSGFACIDFIEVHGNDIYVLLKEVERKDKTIAELRERINGELEVSEQVVQEREELILENEQLQKALEWYADKKNYDLYVDSDFINQNNANDDSGERARRALKEGETK